VCELKVIEGIWMKRPSMQGKMRKESNL